MTHRNLGTALVLAALTATAPAFADGEADRAEIRRLVQQWVEAADGQNPALAESTLHPQAMQYLPHTKAPGGLITFSRDQYVASIRAKKIGGSPRETTVLSIETDERSRNAVAKIEVRSETMIFYQFLGLTKAGDKDWTVVSVLSDIVRRQ